jgi:hypothetical protein
MTFTARIAPVLVASLITLQSAQASVERLPGSAPTGGPVITFSETAANGQLLNYLKPNPVYTFNNVPNLGQVNVSFGSLFQGQTAGAMNNSLNDTTPSSPLALDLNAPAVGVIMDSWAADKLVLGGMDLANMKFFTTPIAVQFSKPVHWVGFDVGSFDHAGTTVVEAFDADGNSLGAWFNDVAAGGVDSFYLRENTDANTISGLSIYVPTEGMDWEGFAVDNLRFEAIPEPATFVIWLVLGAGALGVRWWFGWGSTV